MTEIPISHYTQPDESKAGTEGAAQETGETELLDPANTGEVAVTKAEEAEPTSQEIADEMKLPILDILGRKRIFDQDMVEDCIANAGYDRAKALFEGVNLELREALKEYIKQLDVIGVVPEPRFVTEVMALLDRIDQVMNYMESKPVVEKAEKDKASEQAKINMRHMLDNIAGSFKKQGSKVTVDQDVEIGLSFRHHWEMIRDDLRDMTSDYQKYVGVKHDSLTDEAKHYIEAINVFLKSIKELEQKQEAEQAKLERLYKETEILINKPDGLLFYAIPIASGKKNRVGKSRAREAVRSHAPDGVYKSALKIVENFDGLITQISSMPNYDPNRIAKYKYLLRIAAEYVYELAKQSDPRGVEGYRNSQVLPQDPNSRTYRRPVTVGVHNAFGKQPLESIDLSELGFMIPKSAKSTASVFRMNGNRANVLYPGYDNTYDESLEGPLPSANFLDLRAKIANNKYKKNILKFKEQGLNLNTELLRGESFEEWLKRAANTSSAAQAVDIGNRMIAHYLKRNYRAAGFLVPNLSVGDVGKDVSYMRAIIKAAQ